MALAETARLIASLELDARKFTSAAGKIDQRLSGIEGHIKGVGTRSIALGSAIGTGIERLAEKGIGVLFSNLRAGQEGLTQLQDAQAQTAAVIESTGGKAGVTAKQVRALAEAQEALTTVDDKVIQSGENMLLTFTNIGSDIFPQATKAMVDMAVAMNGGNAEGIDLQKTAIQIGKALQDPIKGATALRKVGVALTDQQQKQIAAFIKAGDLASAQKVILKELGVEFGKAGEAAGTSGAAGVRRLADAVEDAQIQLADGLAPALDRIRGKLATALADPKTQAAIKHLGEWLGDAAEKGIEFASKIPWGQVADGLQTAAGFAGKLVDVFAHMPPEAQAAILALAGLSKLSGGGVFKIGFEIAKTGLSALFQRGSSPAAPMYVKNVGLGGAGGGPISAGGGLGVLGKVALIGEAIGLVAAVISVKDAVSAGLTQQAKDIHGTLTESLAQPQSFGDLTTKLAAIDTGINQINSNPLNVLVGGDALAELQSMRADVVAAIVAQGEKNRANLQPLPDKITQKQAAKFNALRDKIEGARIATVAAQRSTTTQTRTSGSGIIGAIRALDFTNNITINVPRTAGTFTYRTGGTLSSTKLSALTKLA